MRIIGSDLLAAQRSASARPYIHAVFSDYHGDTSRLRYQRHYTGAEGEYYSAAAVAADGSLVRARIDPATKVLYTQRVANPAPGSTFSAWTSHGTVSASGAVALSADATLVSLFYVDADTVTLRVKQSNDNGATYGSATTVATAAAAVTYLAAACGSGASAGQIVLLWTVGNVVRRSRYATGAWGAATTWSNSVASLTGIACAYRQDWDVVVCGTETTTTDAKVWTCVFGDGVLQPANTWGALVEVQTATAGSNVTFRAPALAMHEHWRLFFVEKYTGTQAYARLQWTVMHAAEAFDASTWREPAPFDYTGDHGVAAAAGSSALWLASTAGVWAGTFGAPGGLDVADDVVEAQVEQDETSGSARLVLRNDASSGATGRYAGYGSGTLAGLRRGARLDLAPGYYTATGPEASLGDTFWVESIEQTTGADARLIVKARDGWWLLDRWRARRQYAWAAGSTPLSNLLAYVAARAGLSYAPIGGSTTLFNHAPAFTIAPGESARTAILRLAAMVPDRLFMRGSVICSRNVSASDAADYAYGVTHAIKSARYVDNGSAVNRSRVAGAGAFNEGFDFAEIEAMGERIALVADRNLTTALATAERAAVSLRDAALAARHDELHLATLNTAQELLDVVEVTDAQAGIAAAKRRVRGVSWRYAGANPRYDMTLTLGAP